MSERIFPKTKPTEVTKALSLIDATTVDFSTSCAIWFCEKPDTRNGFNLSDHFPQSLTIALDAYPQWTGHLKSITSLDSSESTAETAKFPRHARRYGRVYVHYGTSSDPGVEFVTAQSTATLDTLCPASRPTEQPIYNRQGVPLDELVPSVEIANATRLMVPNEAGILPPLMAVQITHLACGGFALSAKVGHPLSDISSLVHFVKDWASISRWILSGSVLPAPLLEPIFEPDQLDSVAAADINADTPDPEILKQAAALPLHRYDWWISTVGCPWEAVIPEIHRSQEIHPVGTSMPWSEWDSQSPVSHYVIHLTYGQVETIWKSAIEGSPHESGVLRISRHDTVLAHIWSCIARARNQHEDSGPLHCDLTLGLRSALHLEERFVGSPSMMVNIEMTGTQLTSSEQSGAISQSIRKTINQMIRPAAIAAHLHSLAYETCPQRIWQAFLGSRHLLVTSWARAGVYDVDFGLNDSPRIRYAEGVIPDLDGCVLIKEAPPSPSADSSGGSWTDNGVDVSIHLRAEDMKRLTVDPLLLPRSK
ncbi:transferase family protein [Penicillium longicatenatum]|uniref:transferase family protein n=1 Tax=Penicillium longicatenatum TaxID=1561947 RepID=UPI0025491ECC|nr:transferase family protein [Penicillium longicatenatum]KAJ5651188.1 transferase family protein [Penicillium longicatenatum]